MHEFEKIGIQKGKICLIFYETFVHYKFKALLNLIEKGFVYSLKYAVFNFFAINAGLEGGTVSLYENVSAPSLDKFIREELKKVDDISAATTFIFSRMSVLTVNLIRHQQMIQQLQSQLQK